MLPVMGGARRARPDAARRSGVYVLGDVAMPDMNYLPSYTQGNCISMPLA
jgi:hypothetical protein